MSRRATFWSFLDQGRCRMCLAEGRTMLIVDLDRAVGRGDSLRARNALVNHCRSWHPTLAATIESGEVLSAQVVRATMLDNVPAIW